MISALALTTLLTIGQGTSISETANYWRSPVRCGPNCLYAYLKLHGQECSLEQIASRVVIEPSGANLADLRRAATDLGVPSVVGKTDEAGLDRVALPAIVHFRSRGGHYQLLLAVQPGSYVTADMTSGEIHEIPREKFLEGWTGYVLTRSEAADRRLLAGAAGGVAAIALLAWSRRGHRAESTLGGQS